jgi:hypothetical protein
MADFHDLNDVVLIIDGVDHPVIALSNPISILPGQLFTTRRPCVTSQGSDAFHNTPQVLLR